MLSFRATNTQTTEESRRIFLDDLYHEINRTKLKPVEVRGANEDNRFGNLRRGRCSDVCHFDLTVGK